MPTSQRIQGAGRPSIAASTTSLSISLNVLAKKAALIGEATKTIAIEVIGDTLSEYDERFYVELSEAVGADIHRVRGVGTITNDDASQ